MTSKDATLMMGHLNDVYFSCWCTGRLHKQLTESFAVNFPEAGMHVQPRGREGGRVGGAKDARTRRDAQGELWREDERCMGALPSSCSHARVRVLA